MGGAADDAHQLESRFRLKKMTHSCGALVVDSGKLLLPSLREAAKLVRGVLYVPLVEVSHLCKKYFCFDGCFTFISMYAGSISRRGSPHDFSSLVM